MQTVSAYNTPLYPVSKPNVKDWRFTQDLRHINDLIIPAALVVPDVLAILL